MEVNNIETIQANVQLQSRINRVRLEFPDYINDYFDSLQNKKQLSTTLAYAYDTLVFLKYLLSQKLDFIRAEHTTDITIDDFNKIDIDIINNYVTYIKIYKTNDNYKSNSACGVKRKLESLRNLYKYLYINKKITTLVTVFIDNPKIHHNICPPLSCNDIKELEKVVIEGQNQSRISF
jgi:site-specific recombinase XerD